MRCYPEHPAPARNLLVVPVAAQSLPVAEPQTSIGSMVAESAVLVALAEQVGVVQAVVAVQVARA